MESEHMRFGIGLVPEGWRVVELHEVASIRRGLSYDTTTLGEESNGIPYINMKSFLKEGGYNPLGLKFYCGSFSKEDFVTTRDILIANTDLTPDGNIIGVPALVPTELIDKQVLLSHHVTSLRLDHSVSVEYMYWLLRSAHYRREMRRIARGTTVLMLDLKALRKIQILLPPLSEQCKIAEILFTVQDAIDKMDAIIRENHQLEKGLMQVLLTGKVRVQTNE